MIYCCIAFEVRRMKHFYYDTDYMKIVQEILQDSEFQKIEKIEHHGITRMDHSIKVSYYSYKIAKALKLSDKEVARAGLLHDFFLSKEERNFKDRFISTFTHPKKAVETAEKNFTLNEVEENIIHAHMFPFYCSIPKYADSWVVTIVDKFIGSAEFVKKFGYKLSYIVNIYMIVLFNTIK